MPRIYAESIIRQIFANGENKKALINKVYTHTAQGTSLVFSASNNVIYVIDRVNSSIVTQNREVDYGVSVLETDFTPTKEGWTFVGWKEDKSASLDNILEEKVMGTEPITLYAVYKQNVSIVINGEELGGDRYFNAFGEENNLATTVTIPNPKKSYDGWDFEGYTTTTKGTSEIIYYVGDEVSFTEPVTLYGIHSRQILQTFIHKETEEVLLTQYRNDSESANAYLNPKVTFPIADNKWNDWTFRGWSASGANTGNAPVKFTNGQEVTATDNNTFYALYEKDITLTYKANGGTGSNVTDTKTAYSNAIYVYVYPKFDIKDNPFSRTGYSFSKWGTTATGGTTYTPDSDNTAEVEFTSSTELHAIWSANNYTYNVVYVSSSGKSLGSTTVTKKFGTTNTITAPAKDGYETPESISIKWDSTSAKTITFTYELITYSISYNLNSGTNPSSVPKTYDVESKAITLPNPTRTAYTFDGWYINSNFSGSKVTTIPVNSTGNKTFYAKWNPVPYSITYVLYGGTNPSGARTSYNTTEEVSLPTPTRSQLVFTPSKWNNEISSTNKYATCTFLGWYTSATGGTKVTKIAKGSTGNKTYYARWKFSKVTLPTIITSGNNTAYSDKWTFNTDGFATIRVSLRLTATIEGTAYFSCGNEANGNNAYDLIYNSHHTGGVKTKDLTVNQGNYTLRYKTKGDVVGNSVSTSTCWVEIEGL